MKGLDSIPPTVILDRQFFSVQKSQNKFVISDSKQGVHCSLFTIITIKNINIMY